MMQMSRILCKTVKVVTMVSMFSVTKGILAMQEKRVFGQVFAKQKRRGWPVLVPGKYIDELFNSKPMGHCKTCEQVVKSVKYLIHC